MKWRESLHFAALFEPLNLSIVLSYCIRLAGGRGHGTRHHGIKPTVLSSHHNITMANRSKALSLYKSILRAHERYLPNAMRSLGDSYVKNEFRLHKSAQPEQAVQFFDEWENYLRHIEQTGREKQSIDVGLVDQPGQGTTIPMGAPNNRGSFGKNVGNDVELSEEQQSQLEKLREEAAKAGLGNN